MDAYSGVVRSEMLQYAATLAHEKNIEREIVFQATEEALSKVAKAKYGQDHDVRAEIDRKTGDIRIRRYREVVETVENEVTQLSLPRAQKIKPDAVIGEFLVDELPPVEFGRTAAQTVKQVVQQKVRDAEREQQYLEFHDRVGEIVNGTVKRVDYGNVTVDLIKAEAVMRRDETIPREIFKVGDRVRALVLDVRREPRGPQIFLSRTHPKFLERLFAQEVPEIFDKVVEIKGVARDPGSRAKIAVISHDSGIDPVGACVGMRGSRVQAVGGELQGEKIDIIPWTEDTARFVVQALAPAQVSKVVMDEEQNRMDIVVPDDQLSLAIGRRGQNVKLASQLSGWDLVIMTEQQDSDRRQEESRQRVTLFMEALDVDDILAQLLVAEGFARVEDLLEIDPVELAGLQGFDEALVEELRNRATAWMETQNAQLLEKLHNLGIEEDLLSIDGLTVDMMVKLGEAGVKTANDLADLAGDELVEIVGEDALTREQADQMIMALRARWFDDAESGDAAAEQDQGA